MTKSEIIQLFAPVIASIVLALAAFVGALVTGLLTKAKTWLDAHGEAAAASAVASANTVVQSALQTGASTIAGKISTGQLDYTNRAQLVAEATREVSLVEQRVPAMVATAAPVAGALVASLMAKVDAAVVASPTLPSTPIVAAVADPAVPASAVPFIGKVPG